jgi:class 3 adenylate cyclase
MQQRVRFGLKYRLLLAMLLCAVGPGVWLVQNAQARLSARHVAELRQMTEVVTLLVANMRASADDAQQFEQGMLSKFVRQVFVLFPNLAYLIVTDEEGNVEYGRVNPRLVQAPEGAAPMSVLRYLAKPENGRSPSLSVVTVNLESDGAAKPSAQIKAAYSLVSLQEALKNLRVQSYGTLGAIALLALVGSLLIARSMARPIERMATAMAQVGRGQLDSIPITSSHEIGIMEQAFNGMVHGLREGQRMEDRFRRYVSPEIVDEIMKHQEQIRLAGERRYVTVLFSDVRGFTSMSEVLPPDAVMQMLNELFAAMTPLIMEEGGMLDKFIGDCIMAVWGAPLDCRDQELRAVRCAMRMHQKLEEVNAQRLARGAMPIQIGVGINSGVAIAGNVGSQDRLAYTVIGDTVNVAQRLESLCRDYPESAAVVGHVTYEKVREQYSGDALPEIMVKGRSQPVNAFVIRRVPA